MASPNENLLHNLDVNSIDWAKNVKRKKPNEDETDGDKIRQKRKYRKSAGRDQPDELCNCPQNCGDKVPTDVRKKLFVDFGRMLEQSQDDFLQKYIEMRSVNKRLWSGEERVGGRLQRRVSCKYRIPICLQDEKGEAKLPTTKVKTDPAPADADTKEEEEEQKDKDTVEVCQKAFMNMYAITEKKIRLVREKLISDSRKEAGLVSSDVASGFDDDLNGDYIGFMTSINRDMSIVDTFFCNQLWKPEYIGYQENPPPSDKKTGTKKEKVRKEQATQKEADNDVQVLEIKHVSIDIN